MQHIFTQSIDFRVGNGKLISFWHDKWNLDKSMKDIFPELFILPNRPQILVAGCLRTTNPRSQFRKILNSAATEKFEILKILINRTISGNNPDSIKWKWHQSGKFTIKECYKFLRHGCIISQFPKFNWKTPLPPKKKTKKKTKVFNWLTFQDRVLTVETSEGKDESCHLACYVE